MTNRLRNFLRTFYCCVSFILLLTCFSRLTAQSSFFNFNYNGPDSLSVGVNCNLALQGNIPNPIVTSTIGATIITSMFDAATSGFPFNQLWIGGETAHIYWFVEDNMGHSHTFEFFVFFVDNTPPTFDLTGINDTLFFNSIVQVPAPPMIPIMDNCTGFVDTFYTTTPPDTCAAGQFTRTWKATDMVGNQATFTQTIIIAADVTPPTITFPPQNGSAACELLATAYPAWLAAQMAAFTAQDPSGIKSLTNNGPASFPPGCKVPLTVTFKATDNCNLMIPTTAVFSTSDTQGPVVVVAPKDTISYCSPGGNHLTKLNEWIHTRAYSQMIDACSAPLTYSMKIGAVTVDSAAVVAAFWASFNNACGSQTIGNQMVDQVSAFVQVIFLATDACGNPTTAGQATFGAVDTLAPVITGVNTTEPCGAGNDQIALQNWINVKGNAAIADDCSAAFWTNYSYTTSNGQTGSGAFNVGPYPTVVANNCTWFADVTFRANDECGNMSAKTLRFEIIDEEAPVFTGLAPNITVYCPNPLPTVPDATITDNCDLSPSISFSRVFKDSTCAGNYRVITTWQVTDDCGNTDTISQNIFVRDTTKPVFTLVPAGLLMRCDTFVLPAVPVQGQDINATDLCSPVMSITTATTSTQLANPALCGHYSYTITRTFTATDQCSNSQTATQIISVIDNQPPVPGGVLDTTALCSAMVPFPAPAPLAFDFCSGPTVPPSYVFSDTINRDCAGKYTIQLNWIATDYCGNQTDFVQLVHVIDTVAPILTNLPPHITVECNAIPPPPNVSTFNGVDNCSAVVTVILEESEIRNPNLSSCDHWTNYTLRREWTASDDCGRSRTYTQDIQIVDTTPPVLVVPSAFSLPNDIGDCGRQIPIPAPLSVTDICTTDDKMVLLKDTLPILPIPTMSNGGQLVDTMFFHFAPPNLPPNAPATSSVSISVFLEKADAEEVMGMEFFKVFGEGGDSLGRTSPAPGQCSNTPGVTIMSMTAAQFNLWASDGDLAITLVPVGINPICPNGRVRMNIAYSYTTPHVPIAVTYSLDGGPSANYPPAGATFLGIGTHTVVYTATDCAGNSSTASVQIVVNDIEPPSIAAPAPMTTYVSPGNCMDTVTLPFPVISENCKMSGHLKKSSTMQLLSFYMNADAPGPVPVVMYMNIPSLIPNAIANGTFRIKFRGDNADPREFFNLFPDLSPIQITSTSAGMASEECQVTRVDSTPVSANNINTWAAGGSAVFRAEANLNAGPLFDFDFINPCVALLPNQTDGISRIQVELEYDYAIINFTITNNLNAQQVASGAVQGTQTTVTPLPPGNYTVKYTTTDHAGLMSMTTFPLVIRDTIRPTAHCKDALIINVNPSGLAADNYVLLPSEINLGSNDNCSGSNLTYSLSQNTFNCSQAGSNYNIVMTVSDASGNTSTCSTVVSVQNATPSPTYPAVCEGDTLKLSANPPFPSPYSYMWTGPSFAPTEENPVIINAQPSNLGLYTVKITGFTGCTATGSITVVFANLNVPEDFNVSGGFMGTKFCEGQNIELNVDPYMGPGVSYQWYSNDPVPTLIDTTILNTFTVNQPTPGLHHYFVKVKIGDCLTPNSTIVAVEVFARPPAIVVDDFINVCAGDPLALATNVSGSGLTYLWNGPMWGGSMAQNPLVTSTTVLGNSGIYTLRTFQNGCESLHPDTAVVVVHYTPPKPQIFTNTNICLGNKVVLKAQGSGMPAPDYYEWQDPSLNTFTTNNIDSLVLTNANMTICGNWRVRAGFENCFSDWSNPLYICPEVYPIVTAASNSPICTDSTLHLSATSSIGGLSWCWTLPSNNQIFSQNPNITPGVPGVYQVIGKTSHGCADTATVTVVGSISPIIDTIALTAPICEDGSSAILIPTVNSIHGPNFLYIWTNGIWTQTFTTATFTIPTVGPSDNGPYTLIVKDTFGCPSNPKTVNLNVQAMVKMPTMLISSNPVCEGGTITLSVKDPDYVNALYHWIDPNLSETITSGPQLVLTGVSLAQAGNYTMYVSEGVCQSPLSNTITLIVNPVPATPIITSNQPICPGFTLTLDANVSADQYMWTGPFGYTSVVRNPIRPNAMLPFEGTYTVVVTVKGCTSAPGTIHVDIMQPPTKPRIRVPVPQLICLEQLPLTGFLHVEEQWQTPGAVYTWINSATGDTIPNPSPLSQDLYYATLPPSILTPGWHSFKVLAWKQDNINGDGCSILSDSVSVRFDTIPDNFAQVVPDHPACAPGPILLEATHPSGNLTGHWTFLGDSMIIYNRDSSTANFSTLYADSTYSFSWSLSSGGCLNFSADTLNILVSNPEQAHAGRDTFICDATGFSLYALPGQNSPGTWSQFNQSGVVIADPSEPNTPITGLNPGNPYNFVWTLEDIGCGAPDDTVHVFYYSVKPNITGPDFVCNGINCANLSSLALQIFEQGTWTSKSNNLVFTPPNSPNTTVCGLVPGDNEVYWTINNGKCGSNSTDTFVVKYEIFPTAMPDAVPVEFGNTATFQVLTNDILPDDNLKVDTVQLPLNGTITFGASPGAFIYRPNSGFSGTDVFVYKICNRDCGDNACSTATVTLIVGEAGECFIPTIITPNGDNLNDAFRLPPECYLYGEGAGAEIEVTIFNQWGDYVYHQKPFIQDVDAWDGKYNGADLPAGTYYYVVKFEGADKPKAGFIVLQR